MISRWPYLMLSVAFSLVACSLFAMMRIEQRRGHGYRFFQKIPSWTRGEHPLLFKARIGSWWIGIAIFSLAALANFIGFLGIVE